MLTATRSHSKHKNNKTTPRLTQIAGLSGFEPTTLLHSRQSIAPSEPFPPRPNAVESELTELPLPPPPLASSSSSAYCHTPLLPSDQIPHSTSDLSCSTSVSWLDVTGRATHREREGRKRTHFCVFPPLLVPLALQLCAMTTDVNLKALGGHERAQLRSAS